MLQRVAVLHLEERCERAIDWALKIEPSIKFLVMCIFFLYITLLLNQVSLWVQVLDFPYPLRARVPESLLDL